MSRWISPELDGGLGCGIKVEDKRIVIETDEGRWVFTAEQSVEIAEAIVGDDAKPTLIRMSEANIPPEIIDELREKMSTGRPEWIHP